MISHIIPAGGSCAYFIHTNLQNIAETCGMMYKDFDMVFLTSKTISPELQEAFEFNSKKYKFRVIQAPFETDLNMILVDWAVRNTDINKWFSLQHMDTFWKPESIPWMKATESLIKDNPNNLAIASYYDCSNILFDGKDFVGLTDFCGAYNKEQLIDKNLYFKWGSLEELNTSIRVKDLFKCCRFTTREFTPKFWVDGGELITCEVAAHYPHLVKRFNFNEHLIHPWSLVRPILQSKIRNNTLNITFAWKDFQLCNHNWMVLSLISSCHFDLKQNKNIWPWKVFSKLYPYSEESIRDSELFQIMSRYEHPDNVLGTNDDMGIKYIKFCDTAEIPIGKNFKLM